MPDYMTEDEHEVVRQGTDYESLKQQPGYRRLINFLADYCNKILGEVEQSDSLDPIHTARLVDRWKASERLFQEFQTEIETSIANSKEILARSQQGEPNG